MIRISFSAEAQSKLLKDAKCRVRKAWRENPVCCGLWADSGHQLSSVKASTRGIKTVSPSQNTIEF
jgi:ribosomal protein L28